MRADTIQPVLKSIRPPALLWSAAVVLVYAYICVDTLFHPFNPGEDQTWASAILGAGAIAAVLHFLAPRRALTVVIPGLIAISAIAIIILSGSVTAVLIALVTFGASIGAGFWILRLLGIADGDRPLDSMLIALMLGIAILACTVVALGSVGLLRPAIIVIVLLIAGAAAIHPLRDLGFPRGAADEEKVKEAPALLAIGSFMALINLVWAVAPEVQYDALNYHLPVPAAYASAGRVVDLLFIHSYLAGLTDSFYAIAFVFRSQGAAELVSFGLALASALGVYTLTSRIAGRRVALWAATLFYTTPLIVWAASTSDVDLAVGAFVIALVISIVRWHETGGKRWFLVAGIIIGGGIGTKPTFGLIMPAVIALLVWYVFRGAHDTFLSRVRTVALMTVLALLVCAPWYLIRASFTGNPLYPGGGSIFESNRPSYAAARTFGGNFRIPFTPDSLAFFPFRFTFDTDAFSESGVASGGAGPWLLLAVPGLWLAVRDRSVPLRVMTLAAVSYVALWAVVFSYARFFIPVLPLLVPLGTLAVWRAAKSRRSLALGAFALILASQSVVVPVQYWIIPDRIPIRNALGLETDEGLLRRALPGFTAVQFVNRTAQPGDVAIGLGFERSRHYLDIPFHSFRGIPELRPVARIEDPKALIAILRERGYGWLLIDRSEPHNQETYIRQSFAEKYGRLRFSTRNHLVYRLETGD